MIAASGWIFTKIAVSEFSPYAFVALRFLIASTVLGLFCIKPLLALSKQQWLKAAGTGSLLGIGFLSWILAVESTDSVGTGSFIISLVVIIIPLINRVFFKETLTKTLLLALMLSVMGLAMLALDFEGSSLFGYDRLLFALSTLSFAAHIVLTGKFASSLPALPLTTIQLFVVGVIAASASAITGEWNIEVSETAWMFLLLSALIATSLRFLIQTKALAHVHSTNAGLILILEPIWTSLLGMAFLDERFGIQQMLGCTLILSGLLLQRGKPFLALIKVRMSGTKNQELEQK